MKRIVVVGMQWGDEGKGKITDYLAQKSDVVVRFQGGANAGHTVVFSDTKYSLHLLPSGILNPDIVNIMANGMVIDPIIFKKELDAIKNLYTLYVSSRATIVLPIHKDIDLFLENSKGDKKIGTTAKGIGPAYTDKVARIALKVADFVDLEHLEENLANYLYLKRFELKAYGLSYSASKLYEELLPYAVYLKRFVTDTSILLNNLITENKTIIFEGAQGSLLCIENGTYPFVTSSSPIASSVPLNTGIAPWLVDGAVGIMKAYTTRVGEGPFPTEIFSNLAHEIREKAREYGVTTGRPRRIGYLDTVLIRHTKRVSGISYLAITLLDILSGIDELKICVSYTLDDQIIDYVPSNIRDFEKATPNYIVLEGWNEDISNIKSYKELPKNAKEYLKKIEELTNIPIMLFSVGADRTQTIVLKDIFN
ncbi:MAG: adenylosuccinate synthase [Acholeplasmatales bacterium]|jgi:adenylosuccinate synthase|nr:adenylosuccinate synthase [Acholeplasmatales bacterium]